MVAKRTAPAGHEGRRAREALSRRGRQRSAGELRADPRGATRDVDAQAAGLRLARRGELDARDDRVRAAAQRGGAHAERPAAVLARLRQRLDLVAAHEERDAADLTAGDAR